MDKIELSMKNIEENKEQIKNNIRNFIDNRFIPKFAPKSKGEEYEIIEENTFVWEIKLLKEGFTITLYFYSNKEGSKNINMDIALPDSDLIDTNFHKNLDGVFDEAIRIMTEYKIKRILIKE